MLLGTLFLLFILIVFSAPNFSRKKTFFIEER